MPLPSISKHGAKQCTAKSKRSGQRCNNPAAYECRVCRVHGARRPENIKRGADHPNHVHGERSLEGIKSHRESMQRIRELAFIAKKLGVIR